MRLINAKTLELRDSLDDTRRPPYAILSHTWGAEEVLLAEMQSLTDEIRAKEAFRKIEYTCRQALRDGYQYCWIDTCCIDKTSSAELSEAINAMFHWYQMSAVCYTYLADVSAMQATSASVVCQVGGSRGSEIHAEADSTSTGQSRGDHDCSKRREAALRSIGIRVDPVQDVAQPLISRVKDRVADIKASIEAAIMNQFVSSRWFTRGWTLQELIAPASLQFYSAEWTRLGSLADLAFHVAEVTSIPISLLLHETTVEYYCAARRMSWASKRHTTRVEDQAYCLFGLFQINMPLLYGEREKAFLRLQEEILRVTDDLSLLAWERTERPNRDTVVDVHSYLAPSPLLFAQSQHICKLDHRRINTLQTSRGLRLHLPVVRAPDISQWVFLIVLDYYDERFPSYVLALSAVDPRQTMESSASLHLVAPETHRLHLVARDYKPRTQDLTLISWQLVFNTSSFVAREEACPIQLRFVEPGRSRNHIITLTSVEPRQHWDLGSLICDRARLATGVSGFTLRVQPRYRPEDAPHAFDESWRIQYSWRMEQITYEAPIVRYTIRCTRDCGSEPKTHQIGDDSCEVGLTGCCGRKGCDLMENPAVVSSDSKRKTIIFKGLGPHDQLRFETVVPQWGESVLMVILEKRRPRIVNTLRAAKESYLLVPRTWLGSLRRLSRAGVHSLSKAQLSTVSRANNTYGGLRVEREIDWFPADVGGRVPLESDLTPGRLIREHHRTERIL